MTTTDTGPVAYIALTGEFPIAVSSSLEAVQAHAEKTASRYAEGELRWDEQDFGGREWVLRSKSPRTGRWSKTGHLIRTAPVVDPAA